MTEVTVFAGIASHLVSWTPHPCGWQMPTSTQLSLASG